MARGQLPRQYCCAFCQASRAAIEPVARASRSPCSKWMPPYRRERPAWFAASEKVAQKRVRSSAGTAPGSTRELPAGRVAEAPKRSLAVKSLRISAAAALKLLCPEEYSGKGGVGKVAGW